MYVLIIRLVKYLYSLKNRFIRTNINEVPVADNSDEDLNNEEDMFSSRYQFNEGTSESFQISNSMSRRANGVNGFFDESKT